MKKKKDWCVSLKIRNFCLKFIKSSFKTLLLFVQTKVRPSFELGTMFHDQETHCPTERHVDLMTPTVSQWVKIAMLWSTLRIIKYCHKSKSHGVSRTTLNGCLIGICTNLVEMEIFKYLKFSHTRKKTVKHKIIT